MPTINASSSVRHSGRQKIFSNGLRWPQLPLRAHLFALALAPLIPFLLFSLALFAYFDGHHRANMALRLDDKAVQLTRTVDAELQHTIGMLQLIGTLGPLATGDLQQIHTLAKRILSAEPTWANILVLGPAGEHLLNARVPYGTPLPELSRPDLVIRVAQARTPIVSDMVQARVVPQQLVTVYVPVLDGTGVKYVIAAAIEPANWQRLLMSRMGPDMHSLLVDSVGTVIGTTAEQASPEAVAAPGQRLEFAAGAFSTVARHTLGGRVDAYVAARPVSSTGWTVAAYMPVRAFYATFWPAMGAMGTAFVVLLGLALWLSVSLGRSIVRSFSSLVSCVEAVAARRTLPALDDHISEIGAARQALVAVAGSMSDHLEHEEHVRADLEDRERARNEFLAMLGHELRNPLAPIRNAVQLLSKAVPEGEKTPRALAVLDRQTRQLVRLVDDLLDVTRVASGKIELRKELLDMCQLLRDVVEDRRNVLSQLAIELHTDLPKGSVIVLGDRGNARCPSS